MRVLFLIWNYWPGVEGGSERQAKLVAAELARQGHTCLIWTALLDSNLPRKESKDDTTVIRFGRWVPWQSRVRNLLGRFHEFVQGHLKKFPEIDKHYIPLRSHFDFWILMPVIYITRWSFMREIRNEFKGIVLLPDIIHLHEPSWLGGFAVQLAKAGKIPVICQEATNPALPVLGYDVPCRNQIEKYRRNAHFIAMAPYLEADLSAKGVPNEQIHILPNGVKIPARKDIHKESPIVLYVGNFSQGAHWKAFDILFDAWKIIHEQQIGLRLVVLGGGDLVTWKKYVEKLGCASTVEFIGRVTNPEEYYQKAAIFILPSRVEGMSNALLEAQSWGIPCVVSDIPGNTSIIEDGINGLVVPVNDYRSLAASVIKLYEDPALRQQIGVAARQRMKEQHDLGIIMKQLLEIYQVCLRES